MTVCKRCVMDSTDGDIEFDKNGVCNHCHNYHTLERIITQIKQNGKGKPYDCLLGLSGGVDSSFTALLAWQHKLRVLATHLDNGWDTPESINNIDRIIETTHFEFHRYTLDFEEFRTVQLAYLRAGVVDLEVPTDHAISAWNFRLASRHGIQRILSGSNHATEAIMPKAWCWRKNDLTNMRNIVRKFGTTRKLHSIPTMGVLQKVRYGLMGIREVYPLNYMDFNREEAKQALKKMFNWQDYGSKHCESVWTRFYQCYILPTRFGIDKRKAHFSTMICSEQMSRDEALRQLETPIYPQGLLEKDWDLVLKKLQLTDTQFEQLMALPIHGHMEYGSDKWLYNLLSKFKWVRRLNI